MQQTIMYQTFPPKTSLASSNMGLWPASAKYFAVDRPANPAKSGHKFIKLTAAAITFEVNQCAKKNIHLLNIYHELHQTCTSNHDL
jgi:hypothetical protein